MPYVRPFFATEWPVELEKLFLPISHEHFESFSLRFENFAVRRYHNEDWDQKEERENAVYEDPVE